MLIKILSKVIPKNMKMKLYKMQSMPSRLAIAFHYYIPSLKNIFSWLVRSDEVANFTYDITDQNKKHLSHFISVVTGVKVDTIKEYIKEIESDKNLSGHIETKIKFNRQYLQIADTVYYGRRLGWYALARALKPEVVVETGVDYGVGSCVITSALMKNAQEGHQGFYYGTDILPSAGYFFDYPYTKLGKILYGDSIESLKKLKAKIDLFINDSDHSASYERNEYAVIKNKLASRAVIVGDNAHVTDELCIFAQKTGRNFLFFGEKPKSHWYPGAGMGIAFSYER